MTEVPQELELLTPYGRESGLYWRAYTSDTLIPDVIAAYTERYGEPPAHIREVPGLILAGPVPHRVQESLPGGLFDAPIDIIQ